jgi:TrpR-related protein YerC/YecD
MLAMDNAMVNLTEQFCLALLRIDTVEEMTAFLKDVCTHQELKELSERWNVCIQLDSGKSYRKINQETGTSLATITRVARFLKDEPFKGYQRVLKKMKESNNNE